MNDWLPPLNRHIINEIEMKFHVKHKPKNNNKIFCCMLCKKESERHHDDPVPKRNKCQLSWWFNIKCESFFLFFTSFFILGLFGACFEYKEVLLYVFDLSFCPFTAKGLQFNLILTVIFQIFLTVIIQILDS